MTADNITIDNETRNELLNLTYLVFIQSYHDRFVKDSNFYEEKDIQNLNKGLGKISQPYSNKYTGFWTYETEFCATSGQFNTPYFGGKYDSQKYKSSINFYYTIKVPKEVPVNYSVILEIQMDLKETYGGGDDVIWITPCSADCSYITHSGRYAVSDNKLKNIIIKQERAL